MKKTLIIVGIVLGIVLIWVWTTFNSVVTLREGVHTQWSQVETSYQRRFDLIPNLVESVKGVMKQEQAVFTALAEARTRYSGAQNPDEKAQAAGQVESALGRLLVITENYPQLKSSETVQSLMAELSGTENRVSVERGRYNEKVQTYNVAIKIFPKSVIASLFGFSEIPYFKADAAAATAPKVSF